MSRVWLLVAAASLGCAAGVVGTDARVLLGFPLDDAWIHFVYARALSAGQGLAYNPGQLESGVTAPLWTALLTPLFALTRDTNARVFGVKLLGFGLHLASAWLSWGTVRALGVRPFIATGAALMVALDPHLVVGALSGMEVSLCAALLAALPCALVFGREGLAIGTLCFLPLARPEALVPVVWVAPWLCIARWPAVTWPRRAVLALVPWLGICAWAAACFFITGYALPSTFYAKASLSVAAWLHNVSAIPVALRELGLFRLGVAGVLWAVGVMFAWRSRRCDPTGLRTQRVLVVLCVGFIGAVFVSQPLKEPDRFYWLRYLVPVVPLLITLAAIGLESVLTRGMWKTRARRVGLVLLLSVIPFGWLLSMPRVVAHYRGSCINLHETHFAVADYLRAHSAATDWVATHDAGIIRYVTERPVLDLVGLNNHRVVHGALAEEIARTRPAYYVSFPALFPASRDRRLVPVYRARAHHYVISSAPQHELVVYRFVP